MNQEEEKQLTPEETQLEIARLQQQKAEAEARRAAEEAESQRQREERRAMNYEQSWAACIGSSGILWHPEPDELEKLLSVVGVTLRSSRDGRTVQALDKDG